MAARLRRPRRHHVSYPFLLSEGYATNQVGNQWVLRKALNITESRVSPQAELKRSSKSATASHPHGHSAAVVAEASQTSCFAPVEVSGWYPRKV